MRKIMNMILSLCVLILAPAIPLFTTNETITIIDSSYTEAKEAGTYPIIYQYKDKEGNIVAEDIAYLTLTYQRTVVNAEAKEGIDAHDLTIRKGYFEQLTDDDLILLTGAHAWLLTNGESVAIASVSRQAVSNKIDTYQVTFKTAKETMTIVNVVEVENLVMPVDDTTVFNITGFNNHAYSLLLLSAIFVILPLFLISNYFSVNKKINLVHKLLHDKET